MMTTGEKIQELRQKLGYKSQIDFAKACGLSPAAVCQYESNIRRPSTDALMKISKICGVSIEYLCGNDSINKQDSDEMKHAFFRQFNKLTESNQKIVIDLMKSLGKNSQ